MIEPGKWQTREYRLSENAVADNFVCLIGDTKKVHMVFLAAYMVVLLVAVGLGLVDVVVAPSLHIGVGNYIMSLVPKDLITNHIPHFHINHMFRTTHL